jgi:putative phage-type endonuclease
MNKPYTIINLTQGTSEWLHWRHDGIGASEASSVMGENQFQSPTTLFNQKCSPPTKGSMNQAMARGVALEPKARAYYNQKLSIQADPQCLQSNNHEWLRASLDGITPDGSRVVEIKCGQSAYNTTLKTRQPPKYYYGQFQHILAVTGLDSIDYCCYFPPGHPLCITIPRNQRYIDKLLRQEEMFWTSVLRRRQEIGYNA